MNINIIASSCSELNNKHIFSLLKNRDKTKNHIIISPDRSQFSIEQRLFEETGEKCFFDINIISLSRLSKQVLKGKKENILTKQSGVALVRKILNENKDKLVAFNKATSFMGFSSSMFETICFYKSCNVLPQDIFVDDSLSLANLKQKDIKLIYTEYEKYLQEEYTDSFNQLKLFANSINKDTFKDTIFYLLEFDDFTRIMYDIILKLSRFSDGFYVSCSYGKDNKNSNIFNNKVYYDLIDLYKSENLDYKITKLNNFDSDIRKNLANNLFAYSKEKFSLSDAGISIREFDNITDEIRYTINDIYSKWINRQLHFSNCAIVVPSLTDYKRELTSTLKKFEIPYYIDESEKLKDNCLIRLIFDICTILFNEYKLSQFSVIIKSPILNFDSNAVCEYDNYLHRIGAVSDMCLKYDKGNEDINTFVNFIQAKKKEIVHVETFGDCVGIILDIYNYILSRIDSYINSLNDIEYRLFSQVTTKFDNINKDILSVFKNVTIANFGEFVEIYNEYFESTNITMPPINSNTLFVADFNSSYVSGYDYLYILGNNEGKLPSQKLDNGLVPDEELLRLPNASKLTPTIAMLNARKVLKLYELVFRYRKELNLSYPTANIEGRLYPNKLIESIKEIGDIEPISSSYELDAVLKNYHELDVNSILFNNLTPRVVGDNLIDYLSNWKTYNTQISYRQLCSSLYSISSDKLKIIMNNLHNNASLPYLKKQNFFKNNTTSISQIETYYRCPYIHFGRYGLRVKENKDTTLKPNDIGTLIHEVLSVLVPFVLKNKDNIDIIKHKANDLLSSLLKKEEYKEIVENQSNAYVIKALYRELDRVVVAITNEIVLSNFEPKYFEYYFDNIINSNGINIKGFVDRIDILDGGFLIIDYKTGDNQFKNYNDVYSGKKLQLLVYAKAFEEKSGLESKGVFYLPISNGFGDNNSYKFSGVMLNTEDNIIDMDKNLVNLGYKSDVVNLQTTSTGKITNNSYYKNMCISREDFDYLLTFAMKQVNKAIKDILLGNINPYPLKDGQKCVCEYCEYKAMCGFDEETYHEIINVENISKLKELEDGTVSAK